MLHNTYNVKIVVIIGIRSGGPILKHYKQKINDFLDTNQLKIDEKCKKDPNYINELYKKYIESEAKNLFYSQDKRKKKELLKLRKQDKKFNKFLYKCWKKPIDYLETLIEIAEEKAISFSETFYEQAIEDNNFLFFALQSIHARSLLISRECLTLLKNGYPDGALSRWRTLYELSVIGEFLYTKQNQDLCERYICYQYVQEYEDEKAFRKEGNKNYTDEAFDTLKSNYDNLLKEFGKDFVKTYSYGWASNFLSKPKVSFKDLVQNTSKQKLYYYYKLSSTYIHGNHKANDQSLGIIPNLEKVHLTGSSNYGLSIPMQNVAISLTQISTHFFLTYSNLDVTITIFTMHHLLNELIPEACKTQKEIESKQYKLQEK